MRIIAKNLIAVNAHIGIQKFNWQPENERFAIGYRNSVIIYNLANTSFYLNKAINFIETLIFKFGRAYIYGLKAKYDDKNIIRFYKINQVVSTTNWRGGFLTNFRNFKKSNKNYKKKFSAVISLTHEYQNYSVSRESFIINLPVVSPVDSNSKPENFTYPIPINANSLGTKKFLAYIFSLSVFKGLTKRLLSRIRLKWIKKKKKTRKKKRVKKKQSIKNILRKQANFRLARLKKSKIRIKKWEKAYNWFRQATKIKGDPILSKYDRDVALYAMGYSDIKPIQPFSYKVRRAWYIKKIGIAKEPEKSKKKKKKKKKKKNVLKKKLKRKLKRLHSMKRTSINRKYSKFGKIRYRFRKFKKLKKFKKLRLKYSNILDLQTLVKNKIKLKRPSLIFKIVRLAVKIKKYTLIYKYLLRRKKKIILLKRLKSKKARNQKKKIIKKLNLQKTRTYYHNFIMVKKPRKKKPYHTKIF